MKKWFCILFLLLACFETDAQRNPAVKIYEKIDKAVVRIETYHADKTMHGQASGVILKSRGWLVTNYHVQGDANKLVAIHNGKEIRLNKLIRKDSFRDIMIFSLDLKNNAEIFDKIPDIKIVDSESLKIGQTVYAIGSPLGFENTISAGIISGLRSSDDSSRNYIQISAPVSPGSSGGAVVDDRGRLIGISTFVVSEHNAQNINFAIRMNDVLNWDEKKVEDFENFNSVRQEFLYEAHYGDKNKALKIMMDAGKKYREELFLCHYYIGQIYESTHKNDSALMYFQKCIDLSPYFAEAYLGMSRISMLKSEFEKGIEYQQKAYQLDPSLRNKRQKLIK